MATIANGPVEDSSNVYLPRQFQGREGFALECGRWFNGHAGIVEPTSVHKTDSAGARNGAAELQKVAEGESLATVDHEFQHVAKVRPYCVGDSSRDLQRSQSEAFDPAERCG